ncbi:phosphoenolpyruvate--protein phosphotransferase [Aestuariibacter salexigens]|uniref:phosphoenolpyruvate--protein phosphotransferase n=1 Tax=Aestuariibacter salexigens TaxID=226010 RepID=UPI000403BC8B|nr:phosphoenolpyruvate--protein phosphotransferase [Aestuariibacter salexigens]
MLMTLKRIVQEVNQVPVLHDALGLLVKRVKEAVEVDSCSIYLADYEQQHFVLSATEGLAREAIGKVSVGFSEGLIGLVGQREEPLNIDDAPSHPRFKQYPEVKEESYHAFLGTPIIHQRKVLGVLTLQQSGSRKFSQDEEAFLVTLAAQIALEIYHANARQLIATEGVVDVKRTQKSVLGIPGSAGLAMGAGFIPDRKVDLQSLVVSRCEDEQTEIATYRQAVQQTREQVAELSGSLEKAIPDDVRAIFQLYHHLLDANSLGREVESKIREGWDAASSLKMVVESYANQFRNMDDPYMQERAIDIIDLSNRILVNMLSMTYGQAFMTRQPEGDCILVAEEISASMLAEFPKQYLRGIISMRGSNNSHAAILARAMGVPAVMGVSNVPMSMLEGKDILLDGYSGEVIVSPGKTIRKEFAQLIQEEQELSVLIDAQADQPSITQDGCEMALFLNAGLSAELEITQQSKGDGVGLFRTEVPFMLRERFPSESEQYELYLSVLRAHSGNAVTMRTLDVGGDKPLPYFPINEENPFLGWRGIRLTLDHPEIFLVQIRAMLRASIEEPNLHIMLPMITSVMEVKEARRLISQAFYEVSEEARAQGKKLEMPKIGVMLEVPAILYQIPHLARKVDFFSVGSNDLTQYLLAVDRNNARVAQLYDSYHPAVLSALNDIIKQSNEHGVPVTVCGELAGEPGGAILLMAMGYRKLSMNAHNLLKVKWVIRSVSLMEAKDLLEEVLTLADPEQVKECINQFLEQMGLGGLVRAGL